MSIDIAITPRQASWKQKLLRSMTTPPQWELGPASTQDASAEIGMPTRILARQSLTPHCVELRLRQPKLWRGHRAGQHIRLSMYINGRREERFYSLTHAPSEQHNTLTIAVQEVESGRVSSYLVNEAQVGTRLHISAAQGDFTLPAPSQRSQALLMLSAGSGITPVMAMLRELRHAGETTKVYHLHYARCAQDLIYAEALYEMQRNWANYQLDLNLTRAQVDSQRTARWSPEQQQQSCPDWIHHPAWACGPDAWLQQLQEHWTAAGVSGQLQTERFFRSVTTAADDAGPAQAVKFSRSAVAANVASGTSLLDAAEQQGLNPAYGCRMGICHSCDCDLISGQVRDLRSGEILAQPGQRIQPCVCTPISPIEVDL